jgi:hypothetical protein
MRTARAAPFPFFPPVTLRSLAQIIESGKRDQAHR